jgi:hypothetical protein
MEMMDWFPETVVRKSEDETQTRKGSKYETIRLPATAGGVKSTVVILNPPNAAALDGKPFFTSGGTLVVPFEAPARYHWWAAGGITLEAVIAETAGLACPVDFTKGQGFTDQ